MRPVGGFRSFRHGGRNVGGRHCTKLILDTVDCRIRVAAGGRPAQSRPSGGANRKQLQKTAQQEYLRTFYEAADGVDGEDFVVRLDAAATPSAAAAAREAAAAAAERNQKYGDALAAAASWDELLAVFKRARGDLDYVRAALLAARAGELVPGAAPPPRPGSTGVHERQQWDVPGATASQQQQQQQQPAPPPELDQIGALMLERAPAFQPRHFAAAAAGLSAAGLMGRAFWRAFAGACERVVPALTLAELAEVTAAVAASAYVPPLQWVERGCRQAKKHIGAAPRAPGALARLLWAWGEWGYSPRDRPFVDAVKAALRGALAARALGGAQLLMALHGVARLEPRYWPNARWMAAFVSAVAPHLGALPPNDVAELLLSLTAMRQRPPAAWVDAALFRLMPALEATAAAAAGSAGGVPLDMLREGSGTSSSSRSGGIWGVNDDDDDAPRMLEADAGSWLPEPPPEAASGEPLEGGAKAVLDRFVASASSADDDADGDGGSSSAQRSGRYRMAQAAAVGKWDATALDEGEAAAMAAAAGGSDLLSLPLAPAEKQTATEGEEDEGEEEGEEEESEEDAAATAADWAAAAAAASEQLEQQQQQQQQQHEPAAAAAAPLGPRAAAVVAWCLGALDYAPPRRWLRAYRAALAALAPAMRPEELADALHGLAGAGVEPGPALARALLAAARGALVSDASAAAAARICASLSRLGLRPAVSGAFAALPDTTQKQQQQQEQQRSLQPPSESDWGAALDATLSRLGAGLTPAQAADILGFAAFARLTPAAPGVAAAATAAADAAARAPPAALAGVLWALGALRYKPPPRELHALLAALQPRLNALGARDLADTAWALCALRHRPGAAWLRKWLAEVEARAPRMGGRALADALWAAACFGAAPGASWLRRAGAAAAAEAASGALGADDAAVVVWALRELGYAGDGGDGGGEADLELLAALEDALLAAGDAAV